MTTDEARSLIHEALPDKILSTWIDLGCGAGTFAYAIAALLDDGSKIIAVDKLNQHLALKRGKVTIDFRLADFEKQELHFSEIDGILMANSLHFIKDQLGFLMRVKGWLKKGGKLILIEYDTDESNAWVPYPITYENASFLLMDAGFRDVSKAGEHDSRIRKDAIFACVAYL